MTGAISCSLLDGLLASTPFYSMCTLSHRRVSLADKIILVALDKFSRTLTNIAYVKQVCEKCTTPHINEKPPSRYSFNVIHFLSLIMK